MRFIALIFISLIPFSYVEIFNVRLLFFQILVGLIFLILKFFKEKDFILIVSFPIFTLLFLCFWILALSLYAGIFNELLAVTAFFLLFFITTQFNTSMLESLIVFYKYAVFFTASGVLVQFLVHKIAGVELFRYQLFGGGRNAYSFIWEDYSFISLFIISAIPLLFNKKINIGFLFLSSILLVASIVTSARTGLVALIIFVALYIGSELVRSLLLGKFKKGLLVIFSSVVFLPVILVLGLESLTGRQATVSSSGRIDGFIIGYQYFKERAFFGFLFDKNLYSDLVTTIPHNVFVYVLYMGGIISFVIFLIWFSLLAFELRYADKRIISSLIICFIGFQFIPSLFSAYFVAVLLGLAMISSRNYKNNNVRRVSMI